MNKHEYLNKVNKIIEHKIDLYGIDIVDIEQITGDIDFQVWTDAYIDWYLNIRSEQINEVKTKKKGKK